MSTEDSGNSETIWTAAVNGDWEAVKQCLEREPSLIDVRGEVFFETLIDDDGEEYDDMATNLSLLHLAAWFSPDATNLKYLVAQGADVNAKDKRDWTPLHYAAEFNPNVEVLKYLVSQGAEVNAKNEDDCTPLHFAALLNSNVEVLKYLVSQSADVNAKNKNGCTPLHFAAGANFNVEILKYLVSQGADIHAKDSFCNKPLYHTCTEENSRFLYDLIKE